MTISRSFLRWLVLIVLLGFMASMQLLWIHQTNQSRNNALNLLSINLQDVRQDVVDASDENLLKKTRKIASLLDNGLRADTVELQRLMRPTTRRKST